MGLVKALGSIIGVEDLVAEVGKTVRQVLPNAEAKQAFDIEMTKMADAINARLHEQAMAQAEINKTEAQHASIFVAGWRPAIGWICAAGLAWNFVLSPLLHGFGLIEISTLNIEYLMTLVMGLLGFSGLRTFEIAKGINRDTLKGKRKALVGGEAEAEPYASNSVPTDEGDAPWNRN